MKNLQYLIKSISKQVTTLLIIFLTIALTEIRADEIIEFEYDDSGRLKKAEFLNSGIKFDYDYDATNNRIYDAADNQTYIPTSVDDQYSLDEDTILSISAPGVLANDFNPIDGEFKAALIAENLSGILYFNEDGSFNYQPEENFVGQESFQYQLYNARIQGEVATVTLDVLAINDPPNANPDYAQTQEETALTINVFENDFDIEDDPFSITSFSNANYGLVQAASKEGELHYIPNTNFNGEDNFTYTIIDVNGGQNTTSVTITVFPEDDPPQAYDDELSIEEDTSVMIDVLANDLDVDNDALSILRFDSVSLNGGQISQDGNQLTYSPLENHIGGDEFSYTISDSNGGESTATVIITVNSVNDAPDAVDDEVVTDEDTSVTIDVLANDSDVEEDTLSILSFDSVSLNGGQISQDGNQLTYVPLENHSGGDQFSYTISDSNGGESTAIVTITINPENDAPDAIDDEVVTDEDTSVTIDVLANDSDVEEDTLSILRFDSVSLNGGQISQDGNQLTYSPLENHIGGDEFSYTISDSNGGESTATVIITVNSVNDAPDAVDDEVVTDEDTSVTIDVLANDSDVEEDTLSILSFDSVSLNGGQISQDGNQLTYVPLENHTGVDEFSYTISDSNGGESTALVTITINPENDAPDAVDDEVVTDEDTIVTIDVLANDSDVEEDALSILRFDSVSLNGGQISQDGNQLTYSPLENHIGGDEFSYTISDSNGGESTATVIITVNSVNDAPDAVDDEVVTDEDTIVTIDVLANDSDVEEDALSILRFDSVSLNGGQISQDSNQLTYVPLENYFGGDEFSYTISDSNGGESTATVTITINPENDAPVAVDDEVVTDEDTSVTIDVLANDSDVEEDALSILSFDSVSLNGGQISQDGNQLTYVPLENHIGGDEFSYTISDSNGGESTAIVMITINPENDAPIAVDDSKITEEDTDVVIDVLANDSDIDGDDLTIINVDSISNDGGNVIIDSKKIVYSPKQDYFGKDTFSYTISDSNEGESSATVTIIVTEKNDNSEAMDDFAETLEEVSIQIDVLANDVDVEGDPFTITNFDSVSLHGGLIVLESGKLIYSPKINFVGQDRFNYSISDLNGKESIAVVSINVLRTNDRPIANEDRVTIDEDTNIAIDVLANDDDIDGDNLTIVSFDKVSEKGGSVNADAASLMYSPKADFFGEDQFNYTISDPSGLQSTANVIITVNPLNDPPQANDDNRNTDEETNIVIDVLANDVEADGDDLIISDYDNVSQKGATIQLESGKLTYIPVVDYNGEDTFNYTISDTTNKEATATVTITVNPVNDPPIASDDQIVLHSNIKTSVNVLINDSDVEDSSLTIKSVTQATYGNVEIIGGEIFYTTHTDYEGTDQFSYQIIDSGGLTAQAVVNVNVIYNVDPQSENDRVATEKNTPITIDVLSNDTDANGDNIIIDSYPNNTSNGGSIQLVGEKLLYTPTLNFLGPDSFNYTIDDGRGGQSTATVTVQVYELKYTDNTYYNLDPTFTNGEYIYNLSNLDSGYYVTSLADNNVIVSGETVLNLNDGETGLIPAKDLPQGATISGIDDFSIESSRRNGQLPVPLKFMGKQFVNPQKYGDYVNYYFHSPKADANIYITGYDSNRKILGNYKITLPKGETKNWNSNAYGYKLYGQRSTVIRSNVDIAVGFTRSLASGSVHRTYGVTPLRRLTKEPKELWGTAFGKDATITAFTYDTKITIYWSNGDKQSIVLHRGQIYSLNSDWSQDKAVHIIANKPISGTNFLSPNTTTFFATNEFDRRFVIPVETRKLSIVCLKEDTIIKISNQTNLTQRIATCSANGETPGLVKLHENFQPNTQIESNHPIYLIHEPEAIRNTVGSLKNSSGNSPYPQGVDDQFDIIRNTPTDLAILANDFDPNGKELMIVSTRYVENGTIINHGNSVTFTPKHGYLGPAGFEYTLSNGSHQRLNVKVQLEVKLSTVPTAPKTKDDNLVVSGGNVIEIIPETLLNNDDDVNGDNLTFELLQNPQHGQLIWVDGVLKYIPNSGYVGTDRFTYRAFDGQLYSEPTTVTIYVGSQNNNQTVYYKFYDSEALYGDFDATFEITSLSDNNIIVYQDTVLHLDNGETGSILVNDSLQNTKLSGTDDFSVDLSGNRGHLLVPAKFMSKNFVHPHWGYQATYYLHSPVFDANVSITVFDSNANPIETHTVTATKGSTLIWNSKDNISSSVRQYSAVINSDVDISVGVRGSDLSLSNPATELWGIVVGWYPKKIAALHDNTQVEIYWSDGENEKVTLRRGETYDINSDRWNANAVHVVADKPISGWNSHEESGRSVFFATKHLDKRFGLPTKDSYLSITCTKPNTIITLSDPTTNTRSIKACSVDGDIPEIIVFYARHGAGSIIESNNPIYVVGTYWYDSHLIGSPENSTELTPYPQGVEDHFDIIRNTATDLNVLANDYDPNGNKLTLVSVSNAINGSVNTNGTTVTFIPDKDYIGDASFQYSISNGSHQTLDVTVKLQVKYSSVPSAPIADNDIVLVSGGNTLKMLPNSLLNNDDDENGDALSIVIEAPPTNGQLQWIDGLLHYSPDAGFDGQDSFTYKTFDGTFYSNAATVTIYVGSDKLKQTTYYNLDPIFDNGENTYNINNVTGGLYITSLIDNNIIICGKTLLHLDDGETGFIPAEDVQLGAKINGIGDYSIESSNDDGQLLVSSEHIATQFVNPHNLWWAQPIYHFYSPIKDAEVSIQFTGSVENSSYTIMLPKGEVVTWDQYKELGGILEDETAMISSNTPIIAGNNDGYKIYSLTPGANEFYAMADRYDDITITAFEEATQVTITTAVTTETVTLGKGEYYEIPRANKSSTESAIRLVSVKPIVANIETLPLHSSSELDRRFAFPLGARSLRIVCPSEDTTLTLTDPNTNSVSTINCASQANEPESALFSYVYVTQSSTLNASEPVYVQHNPGYDFRNSRGQD